MKRTLQDFSFTGGKVKRKETEKEKDEATTASTVSEERQTTKSGSAREHRFQEDWLKKWPWLTKLETGGMRCGVCLKHKKQNGGGGVPPFFDMGRGQCPPFF